MTETTEIIEKKVEKAMGRVIANPVKSLIGAGGLGVLLATTAPEMWKLWVERENATDARIDEAHERTLSIVIEQRDHYQESMQTCWLKFGEYREAHP